MLKVRTAVANCTLDRDHVIAERWARRPGRSDTDRNGQLMKRWTVWRERSFSTRRASSTST